MFSTRFNLYTNQVQFNVYRVFLSVDRINFHFLQRGDRPRPAALQAVPVGHHHQVEALPGQVQLLVPVQAQLPVPGQAQERSHKIYSRRLSFLTHLSL